MKYRTQSKIIAPFIFFAIAVFLPTFSLGIDISTLLTVVSLIFTILVGFFIATATSNYLRLQSILSQEDASLISIFNLCKIIQPKAMEEVTQAIDDYSISSLNYKIEDYVNRTRKEFKKLVDVISGVDPSNEKGATLIQTLHGELNQVMELRQEGVLAAKTVVTKSHWFILVLITLLVDTMLLSLRNANFFPSLLISVLITATYLLLLLIYEVDTNRFLEEKLAYEGSQRVFDAIGRLEYYPEEAIEVGAVPKNEGQHRIGLSSNSNSSKREIKIVK